MSSVALAPATIYGLIFKLNLYVAIASNQIICWERERESSSVANSKRLNISNAHIHFPARQYHRMSHTYSTGSLRSLSTVRDAYHFCRHRDCRGRHVGTITRFKIKIRTQCVCVRVVRICVSARARVCLCPPPRTHIHTRAHIHFFLLLIFSYFNHGRNRVHCKLYMSKIESCKQNIVHQREIGKNSSFTQHSSARKNNRIIVMCIDQKSYKTLE